MSYVADRTRPAFGARATRTIGMCRWTRAVKADLILSPQWSVLYFTEVVEGVEDGKEV
jgi:hypothetical protein